jgi:hypothetical protein
MAQKTSRRSTIGLNTALVVGALLMTVLLSAFATRLALGRFNPVREKNPTELVGDIIQVEVLNACGISGLAGRATQYLRDQGFDVVNTDNYRASTLENTVVVDRVGNLEAARQIARALGLPEDRVTQELKPDYYLDASLLIGQDYTTLRPFKQDQ